MTTESGSASAGPAAGHAGQDAKVDAALSEIVATLASGGAMSGRAVKVALATKHQRAALEAALMRGVASGRLSAVAGARNARLYQASAHIAIAPLSVPSVPSVPAPVSRASQPTEPASTPAPGLFTRRDLAVRMGVHIQTVTKWEQAGLPVAERGRAGKPSLYRDEDVRAWLAEREKASTVIGSLNVLQERARRERAQAVLAEQTFEMRSGDLLPRREVEKVWEAEVSAVRAKLLEIPRSFSDRVYQAAVSQGIVGVERILEESVFDVLRELAGEGEPEAASA